jgi:mono/diheme cytochrome c family protein
MGVVEHLAALYSLRSGCSAILGAVSASLLSGLGAAQAPTTVSLGTVVDAEFLDLRWQPRRLSELGVRPAYVIYFTTIDCPMVQRYLPRIGVAAEEYLARNVVTVVVNVGAGDGFVDAAAQALESAPHAVFGKDHKLALAGACGVDRSGAVVVLDDARRLRYRGRVDDQHGYNQSRQEPSRSDLRLALDEVLAGTTVTNAETAVVGCRISAPVKPESRPTYYPDVAMVLLRHCSNCHSAEAGFPFSLVGEANAQKHAVMIDEVVSQGRMPPWLAAGNTGPFTNRRSLHPAEREILRAWVGNGMPRGDAASFSTASHLMGTGWQLGTPQLELGLAAPLVIAGTAPLQYRFVEFPHRFDHETWIEAIELRSSGTATLQHANFGIATHQEGYTFAGHIGNQVMHGRPLEFPPGKALRVPAGSRLVAQLLYAPKGRDTESKVDLAVRLPRTIVQREVRIAKFVSDEIRIPAGAASHGVTARWTLPEDAIGLGVWAQMHQRGRDVTIVAVAPDGVRQPVLSIPAYSFAQQETYTWFGESMRWPRGTEFLAVAHFDNSPWNGANPDPTRPVQAGVALTDEVLNVALTWVPTKESLALRVDSRSGAPRVPAPGQGHAGR